MGEAVSRTRVKFCGITNAEDALAAVQAGADAVGFVFCAGSPRAVTISRVSDICRLLPPFVARVGLFLDPKPEQVGAVLDALHLDLLQFHGAERAEFCSSFQVPYMKAVGVRDNDSLEDEIRRHAGAAALLFDSHGPGAAGGTGQTFDWQLLPRGLSRPIVLAGGLNAGNVAEAVRKVRPYAVDVSSGVESAPGRKDADLMKRFVAEVKGADDS